MTFKLEQPPVLQSGNQAERNILSRWLYKLWLNKEEIQNSLSADFLLRNGSKSLTGNWDAGSYKITAETFTSDVSDGTAPFTVTSTTLVSNLNAEHWNSKHLGTVADSKLVRYNSTGTQLETGTVTEASGALGAITTIGMSGQLTNTLADGTAPMVITSTTKVTNLNAEHWNDKHLGSVSDGKLLRYNSTGTQLETGTVAESAGALSAITTLSMNNQLTNTLAIGTSPFAITSTTVNTNLNADMVDGKHSTDILLLDQTTPQTIINGIPLMSGTVDTDGDGTQLVNKNYVDLAVSSLNLTEFFHDEADALGGLYKVMDVNADSVGTVVSATLTSTPENIFNFITPVGHPHLDRLQRGIYDCHAHLLKTNSTGNRVITCYYELYQCDAAGGTQVLLGTSSSTSVIGNTDTSYDVYLTIDTEIALATTDRLIIKWYATTVSGTGNTTVTMTTGGTVDSHFTLKIDALELDQIFVPYTGAISDTDLGTKRLTGNIVEQTYTITRSSGLVSSIVSNGLTYSYTRSSGLVSSISDATYTWTVARTNSQIDSITKA